MLPSLRFGFGSTTPLGGNRRRRLFIVDMERLHGLSWRHKRGVVFGQKPSLILLLLHQLLLITVNPAPAAIAIGKQSSLGLNLLMSAYANANLVPYHSISAVSSTNSTMVITRNTKPTGTMMYSAVSGDITKPSEGKVRIGLNAAAPPLFDDTHLFPDSTLYQLCCVPNFFGQSDLSVAKAL